MLFVILMELLFQRPLRFPLLLEFSQFFQALMQGILVCESCLGKHSLFTGFLVGLFNAIGLFNDLIAVVEAFAEVHPAASD